jgi:hypothetical protein
MPDIRSVRVDRLILTGVPPHRRRELAAAVRRALEESAAGATSLSPQGLKARFGASIGRSIANTSGPAKGERR